MAEEEGVPGGRFAGVAHEEAGGNGAAGAGSTGNEGHGLGKSVEDAVLVGQLGEVPLLLSHGVGHGEDQAEDDQHGGHDPHAAQHRFDLVLEQQPEDDDGKAAKDDQPSHPGIRVLPGHPSGQRTRPTPNHADNVPPEIDNDGRFSAQLGDGRECCPGVFRVGQELPHDPQVRA